MSNRTASSWVPVYGRYGPVRVSLWRNGKVMKLTRGEDPVLAVDLYTGRARVFAVEPDARTRNAINRLFELADCHRYKAEFRGNSLMLIDSIKKTIRIITEAGILVLLPTRGVFNLLAYRNIQPRMSYYFTQWKDLHKVDRQAATDTLEHREEAPY